MEIHDIAVSEQLPTAAGKAMGKAHSGRCKHPWDVATEKWCCEIEKMLQVLWYRPIIWANIDNCPPLRVKEITLRVLRCATIPGIAGATDPLPKQIHVHPWHATLVPKQKTDSPSNIDVQAVR